MRPSYVVAFDVLKPKLICQCLCDGTLARGCRAAHDQYGRLQGGSRAGGHFGGRKACRCELGVVLVLISSGKQDSLVEAVL